MVAWAMLVLERLALVARSRGVSLSE